MSIKKSIAGFKRGAARRAAHQANMRIRHFMSARYWRGHSVHSPFVYHIVRHVISGRHQDGWLTEAMERYRHGLLADRSQLMVGSMGAVAREPRLRRVCDIARQTATSDKYGRLLARLAREMRPLGILELGTSMGVSAAYMAAACPAARLLTIEGIDAVADVARHHLAAAGMTGVTVLGGDIDERLPEALDALPDGKVEMAFIDANHSREATMRYFEALTRRRAERCLLVFDDIYWSAGMTEAWRDIVADSRVMTTIELPRMGLAFFRPGCQKEHYVVRW